MDAGASRWSAATLSALVMLAAGSAAAGPVVSVRSADLPPMRMVEDAFAGAFGQEVWRVDLSAEDGSERLRFALNGAALVLAIGPQALKASGNAGVPVVATLVPNPDGVGLPRRGVAVPMVAPPSQHLAPLRDLLPGATRIGILYDPVHSKALVEQAAAAAESARLMLVKVPVASRQEVAGAARALVGQIDVLWLLPDPTVVSSESFRFFLPHFLAARVPMIGFSEAMARAGCLYSVELPYAEMGRQAAAAGRRLLSGDTTAVPPPTGTLILNAKSAQLLGISLPETARAKAARIFE